MMSDEEYPYSAKKPRLSAPLEEDGQENQGEPVPHFRPLAFEGNWMKSDGQSKPFLPPDLEEKFQKRRAQGPPNLEPHFVLEETGQIKRLQANHSAEPPSKYRHVLYGVGVEVMDHNKEEENQDKMDPITMKNEISEYILGLQRTSGEIAETVENLIGILQGMRLPFKPSVEANENERTG